MQPIQRASDRPKGRSVLVDGGYGVKEIGQHAPNSPSSVLHTRVFPPIVRIPTPLILPIIIIIIGSREQARYSHT
ncbi:hypothetical protein MCOR02_004835 [Pyricularia oryzae]|nr:hypothetical protein MCOR02_004835 [Pyricularia oryzae]KAI6314531.1 hypothetical protein MCOR30_009929 [Pyricularia oryzae]KAI6593817.1 hypothetical protein MCOR12_007151 [Pyricularia oryzae]